MAIPDAEMSAVIVLIYSPDGTNIFGSRGETFDATGSE